MTTRGFHKRACAVVLVKHVKNPIKLAREMLVRGETDGAGDGNGGGDGDPAGGSGGAQGHCCLGGETVEKLAKEWGLEMVKESYFWTKKRWDEHRRGLGEEDSDESWELVMPDDISDEEDKQYGNQCREYLPQGTVGCVALDQFGCLCVATSTGGLTNKLPMRIGDTPTIGAGFWAEEWNRPSLEILPCACHGARGSDVQKQVSSLNGIVAVPQNNEVRLCKDKAVRAVALSGTGNGDSFLRLAAARTVGSIVRFASTCHANRQDKAFRDEPSLASAISQIAGPGGELQEAAGDRWGKTGEGEGGVIGIEFVDGIGQIEYDFNCGGMFRCWVDAFGQEKVMVFKDEY